MSKHNECSVCGWERGSGIKVDTSKSKAAWAREIGIGESSVRRHFNHKPRESASESVDDQYRETWKGNEGEITVVLHEQISNDAILTKFGHDPAKVSIIGVLEETHWQMSGEWQHRYRFKTSRVVDEDVELVDPFEVLSKLRSSRPLFDQPIYKTGSEDGSFVISINDIQLGQSFKGGSKATIENFHHFIELAKDRIVKLGLAGRNLEELVIVFGGDLVEGCVIYGNQSYSLDMDRKTQIEGVITLGLHAIDELSPYFSAVRVLACKGNHGENRISGRYTTLYDNDDTHCVDMMRLALSRDPESKVAEWVIAGDEAAVTLDVQGWTLATTHGDVYAKGVTGATIDKKAHSWYKNMAAGRERFGDVGKADVLITHHFHHDKMSDWGPCIWRQTPSQDRGSLYFEQASGEYSEPGMLTWVMTESERYVDELVLR